MDDWGVKIARVLVRIFKKSFAEIVREALAKSIQDLGKDVQTYQVLKSLDRDSIGKHLETMVAELPFGNLILPKIKTDIDELVKELTSPIPDPDLFVDQVAKTLQDRVMKELELIS